MRLASRMPASTRVMDSTVRRGTWATYGTHTRMLLVECVCRRLKERGGKYSNKSQNIYAEPCRTLNM